MKKLSLYLAVFLLIAGNVRGEIKYPAPEGYVNDYAGILSGDIKTKTESFLAKVEEKTGAEIAVATVKTTGTLSVEEYAVGLFSAWGIGKKGKDNGVLVLVAAEDRKVRIEVGYGLEGAITDLKSKLIIEDLMVPLFRSGDYGAGIWAAVNMLAKIIGEEYNIAVDVDDESLKVLAESDEVRAALINFSIFLIFFVIIPILFRKSGRKGLFYIPGGFYWSSGGGGSFGGGFGGFGGGSSGGGGASGSW